MKLTDYTIRPENLPRIKGLGYVRFVLFYAVIPTTVASSVWIPAHRWLTTKKYSSLTHSISSTFSNWPETWH